MKSLAFAVAGILAMIQSGLAKDTPALPAGKVVTTPLVLKEGGTAEKPAVFDGQGMVIDLGIDVTDHAWKKSGDIWTSSGRLLDREPIAAGQLAALFLDELPLTVPRDVAAEKLHPRAQGALLHSAGRAQARSDGLHGRWLALFPLAG